MEYAWISFGFVLLLIIAILGLAASVVYRDRQEKRQREGGQIDRDK